MINIDKYFEYMKKSLKKCRKTLAKLENIQYNINRVDGEDVQSC